MNNKNISNPIYQKLFPETYAKNAKIQATIASIKSKFDDKRKLISPEIPNIEVVEINTILNDVG